MLSFRIPSGRGRVYNLRGRDCTTQIICTSISIFGLNEALFKGKKVRIYPSDALKTRHYRF